MPIFAVPNLGGTRMGFSKMNRHEKDIPTFSTQAPEQTRLPQAHVIRQRTQCFELTSCERPQEAVGEF